MSLQTMLFNDMIHQLLVSESILSNAAIYDIEPPFANYIILCLIYFNSDLFKMSFDLSDYLTFDFLAVSFPLETGKIN